MYSPVSPQLATAIPSKRLAGFYFFVFCVFGIFMPFWSLYLEQLGFSKLQIGAFTTLGMLSRIVTPGIWGYLADKTGKRMLLVRIACTAQVLAWVAICVLPHTFGYMAAVLVFYAVFQNGIIPQFEAAAMFWVKQQQDLYGKIRLWGSLGFMAAVIMGGLLFAQVGLSNLPYVVLILTIIALINAYLTPEVTEVKISTLSQPIWHNLAQPNVRYFMGFSVCILLSHAPFYNFYSNYLAEHGFSTVTIGWLWGLGVMAETLFFMRSKALMQPFGKRSILCFAVAVTSLRWAVVALMPTSLLWQIVAQCMHAVSFALVHVLTMLYLQTLFTPEQQGRAQGLYATMWGVSISLSAVLIGANWDRFGGQMMFMLASIVALLGWYFAYQLTRSDATKTT